MIRTVLLACVGVSLLVATQAWGQDEKKVEISAAEKAALETLRKSGGTVLEIAQNDNRVEVSFHLSDAKIGDKQLEPLKGLKSVYSLNLRGAEVTDAGLANLSGLTGLKRLHLELTKVSDKGIPALLKLESVEYLNLYGTQITNAGLQQLGKMKNLKKVYIWQTKVDIAGVTAFKKAAPKIKVIPDLVVELAKKKAAEKATVGMEV